ncbi:MAG: hypothetical protein L3J83_01685 [Proteobacteria bacterium]|nr:hypothetical protein [Pseudomonadota bacterium]
MKKRIFTDLEERKKVWVALSDLFLDTETSIFHENIVKVLLASPFSVEELNEIMLKEVCPILRWNLYSVAGEWQGFDEGSVIELITRPQSGTTKIWIKILGKFYVFRFSGWQKIIKEIKYRRAN